MAVKGLLHRATSLVELSVTRMLLKRAGGLGHCRHTPYGGALASARPEDDLLHGAAATRRFCLFVFSVTRSTGSIAFQGTGCCRCCRWRSAAFVAAIAFKQGQECLPCMSVVDLRA